MTTIFSEKGNKSYTHRIRDKRGPLGQFTPSHIHADLLSTVHVLPHSLFFLGFKCQ